MIFKSLIMCFKLYLKIQFENALEECMHTKKENFFSNALEK